MAQRRKKQDDKKPETDAKAAGTDEGAAAAAGPKGPENGDASWWRDLLVAGKVLTNLPLPSLPNATEEDIGRSRRAFPLVGFGVALIAAAVYGISVKIGLFPLAASVLAFMALALVTGARGETGLAVFVEGAVRGADPAARLAIMREEPVGYFGALALLFSVLLRVGLLSAIAFANDGAAILIAAVIGSRAAIALSTAADAPPDGSLGGLGVAEGRGHLWVAAALGGAFLLLFLGPWAGFLTIVITLIIGWLAVLLVGRLAGGMTLPGLGFVQQVAEITILLVAVSQL